jgi:hypothetical protein
MVGAYARATVATLSSVETVGGAAVIELCVVAVVAKCFGTGGVAVLVLALLQTRLKNQLTGAAVLTVRDAVVATGCLTVIELLAVAWLTQILVGLVFTTICTTDGKIFVELSAAVDTLLVVVSNMPGTCIAHAKGFVTRMAHFEGCVTPIAAHFAAVDLNAMVAVVHSA